MRFDSTLLIFLWLSFLGISSPEAFAAGFDCMDPQTKLSISLRNHLKPRQGTRRIDQITVNGKAAQNSTGEVVFKSRYTEEELDETLDLLGKAISDGPRYTAKIDERVLSSRAAANRIQGFSYSVLSHLDIRVDFNHNRPIAPGAKTTAWMRGYWRNSPKELSFEVKLVCVRQLENPEDYFDRLVPQR